MAAYKSVNLLYISHCVTSLFAYFACLDVVFILQENTFSELTKFVSNPNSYIFCVPGEKAAGGVREVRLGGWRQATGGDLKVYPTVVGLKVDNNSEVSQHRHSITRLHTSPQVQIHLCCVVPTATQVF